MSTEHTHPTLRRKVAAGHKEYQSRAMTAARALRLTVPKVADDQMELALGVIGLTQAIVASEDILDPPPENRMMLVLDGPDGRSGAALVDGAISAALVQQQTMARVVAATEAENSRAPTRTEAALMSPFLDQVFQQSAELPDSETDAMLLRGRKFGAWIEVPRLLAMALEEPEYQRFTLTLDVDGGVRQGKIDLFLPLAGSKDADAALEMAEETGARMAQITMSVPAQLTVALCRARMSLSDVSKLTVGDRIDVPPEAFSNAELLAITGRLVGHARLGQVAGKRAVRIVLPDPKVDAPKRRASDGLQDGKVIDPLPGAVPDDVGAATFEEVQTKPPLTIDTSDFDLDGTMGDLPDLPELSGDAGLPSLDDMPELDALPDLPDLPELPNLPDLAETG